MSKIRLKEGVKKLLLNYMPTPLIICLKKRHHAKSISLQTVDEEPDLFYLPMLVSAGDMAIDVGANYGVYTKELSSIVGPSGKVISF